MNLQYIRELWANSQEGEGDVGRSAAVIFGVPTCVGNMSWQVKKWLGTNWNVQVGGKLGSAFSTDNSPNGGGAAEGFHCQGAGPAGPSAAVR